MHTFLVKQHLFFSPQIAVDWHLIFGLFIKVQIEMFRESCFIREECWIEIRRSLIVKKKDGYGFILNTYIQWIKKLRPMPHNKQRFTYLHDDSRNLRLTNVSIWKWNRHFLHQKDFDYCTKSKCIASQLIKWNCSFTIFLPEASYRSLLQKHLNNEELHWVL